MLVRMCRKIFILLVGCQFWFACSMFGPLGPGELVENYYLENKTFVLGVDRYSEASPGFVGGAYYKYWVRIKNGEGISEPRREIIMIRMDDPEPISKDRLKIVNDSIAYFYLVGKFGITFDSGKTWIVRSPDELTFEYREELLIFTKIDIDENGEGRISLTRVPKGSSFEIRTNDFGRNWFSRND